MVVDGVLLEEVLGRGGEVPEDEKERIHVVPELHRAHPMEVVPPVCVCGRVWSCGSCAVVCEKETG
jgi:hypothetical protein